MPKIPCSGSWGCWPPRSAFPTFFSPPPDLFSTWYARRFSSRAAYRLYALSNGGSMLALLSYPVLFEPLLTTRQQAVSWSAGYVAFVLACGFTAFRSASHGSGEGAATGGPDAPSAGRYAAWIGLPACASILPLSISTHLSQNVAAIPLLWVLPLSLYLLSFILCFERDGWCTWAWRRPPWPGWPTACRKPCGIPSSRFCSPCSPAVCLSAAWFAMENWRACARRPLA